ncbi:MAG: DUF72 domain-containing protein [Chloroflexaceae bacterium]|jgi:uncharacterized protein YecE (DUF72 family)|nr:DUF72 domain-containing protein [Chloroflexaceae bacterium]
MAQFYIGCAVWAYKEWLGGLFPPGSKSADFLRLYSHRLTTVEGNTTFYATPKPEVVQRWLAETPADFRFCLKLPREVSHAGPLAARLVETSAFLDRMAGLGQRLGPFFLQLPPGYSPAQQADLARWLAAWPTDYRLAVEVRHPAWYAPTHEQPLMELLARHNMGRVLMDVRPLKQETTPEFAEYLNAALDKKPDVPLHPVRSSDIVLLRYIGHPDPVRNHDLLDEWANRIVPWLAEGVAVYAFMHCPDERQSPGLCRELYRRLQARASLPPLPWDEADGGVVKQASMF